MRSVRRGSSLTLLWLLVVCVAPLSAEAQGDARQRTGTQPDDDWNSPGWYVRLGGVYGLQTRAKDKMQSFISSSLPAVDVSSIDDSAGFDGRLGWRMSSYLAAELQLDYLAGFDVNAPDVKLMTYRALVMTGNFKLIVPLGRLQPYCVVGGGFSNSWLDTSLFIPSDDSFFGGAFRAGAGVDLFVLPEIALSVEASYVLPTGDNEKRDYVALSFGILYPF